tara:strand:+ start:969 stop:1580 length:612 start_codon:yes stop_codon:yes gene_type:complete
MFLYRKEDALSPQLCNSFIESFESSDEKQPGILYGPGGDSSDSGKKSTDITFHPGYLQHNIWGQLLKPLIPVVENALDDYLNRHLTAMGKMDAFGISPHFNMQRYLPGEGFSSWHCERAGLKHSNRVLVWMVYLNNLTDRGETEFLYQQHFEKPIQGKLVIWPSDWTYMHRGVSSPSQTKYILTGWFTHFHPLQDEQVSSNSI